MKYQIRFNHSQIGMMVEVRPIYNETILPTYGEWMYVDLFKYGDTLDTQATENKYLYSLDIRKIKYQVLRTNY